MGMFAPDCGMMAWMCAGVWATSCNVLSGAWPDANGHCLGGWLCGLSTGCLGNQILKRRSTGAAHCCLHHSLYLKKSFAVVLTFSSCKTVQDLTGMIDKVSGCFLACRRGIWVWAFLLARQS